MVHTYNLLSSFEKMKQKLEFNVSLGYRESVSKKENRCSLVEDYLSSLKKALGSHLIPEKNGGSGGRRMGLKTQRHIME